MARTEARIFTSIWKDEDFVALPPSAQRLYMFLLSQDDLTYCGVIPLRQPRWAKKAAGLTLHDIGQDLKALEGTAYPSAYPSGNPETDSPRTPFVITDEDTGELLIRAMIRRDSAWKQPNLLKQARESADQIESPKIRAALLAELRRLPVEESPSAQVKTLVAEFIADLDQGTAYPSAYPSGNPSPNPSRNGSGDPSAKDYACARELGEGYGPALEGLQAPISNSPKTTTPQERRQGTRLPDDFEVAPEMVEWFREHCPHVDGKRETEQFRDYWRAKPGKDGRKLDWVATWRQWMRTAEGRSGPRTRASPSAPVSTTDKRMAEAQALKARLAARNQEPA